MKLKQFIGMAMLLGGMTCAVLPASAQYSGSTSTAQSEQKRARQDIMEDIYLSTEPDGLWVKNAKDFPKDLPIVKVRLKDNGGTRSNSVTSIWLKDSPDVKYYSHHIKALKLMVDKTKFKKMEAGEDGWRIYTFPNPVYLGSTYSSSACFLNVQFFVNDADAKKKLLDTFLKANTSERYNNAALFCEDGDPSHLGRKSGKLRYSATPELVEVYRAKAAERAEAERIMAERRAEAERQRKAAEEKARLEKEEAERQAAEAERKAAEAERKKLQAFGVTNNAYGERFMEAYNDGSYGNGYVGYCFYSGKGVRRNYKLAEEYLLKAVELGQLGHFDKYISHLYLADIYWTGKTGKKDIHKAISHFKEGHNVMAWNLALNEKDSSVKADWLYILQLGAYRLGRYYDVDGASPSSEKSIDKAADWYDIIRQRKYVLNAQYAECCYRFGYYVETGRIYHDNDLYTARECYREAIKYGSPEIKAKAEQRLKQIGY